MLLSESEVFALSLDGLRGAREGAAELTHTPSRMTPQDRECLTNKGRDMTESRTIYPAAGQIAGAAVQFSLCGTATNTNNRVLELIRSIRRKLGRSFVAEVKMFQFASGSCSVHNSAWPISPIAAANAIDTPGRPRDIGPSLSARNPSNVRSLHKVI
ncbi:MULTISPECIES: hypothetical protein [unclassified Bradyrhizobium]|uniref:hypothetical protein n=1 Tax=unclassified Bradyrhizobium TaxID=2631580 RepID=UPI0023046401|nr:MULTISPECIES: hypothetical protein [unclassified Bradyrhizobium]MDA9399907.1 hypothetical protein [Bradyrhizobium sp. CCBAU 45389]MDA9527204.1 hypothetical protein [Bradyrhizobium sp. CCBAU 25338]